MNIVSYKCPQELLYPICEAGWNHCRENLPAFAAHKPKYTSTFIDAALAAIEHARDLTPSWQTIGTKKITRIDLETATITVLDNWQLLKTYITSAYTVPNEQQAQLELAGAALYAKASAGNWIAAKSLIQKSVAFITENVVMLKANNNMPVEFPDSFSEDGNTTISLWNEYYTLENNKKESTTNKIEANNAIYNSLLDMFADAKRIFKFSKALKQRFVFTRLFAIAKGSQPAKLTGYLRDAQTNLPIAAAKLTSANGVYQAITGKNGKYMIARIAAGSYIFTIEKAGYAPFQAQITIRPGTIARFSTTLQPSLELITHEAIATLAA